MAMVMPAPSSRLLMGLEVEHPLQLAAGHLFQALGHGSHAIEEEGQTAAEGKDREDIHAVTPFMNRPAADGA